MTHVFLTGEVGAGKSTALARTLALLNARAEGVETRFERDPNVGRSALYLRAYGSGERGCLMGYAPGGDRQAALPCFEVIGSLLLRRAHTLAALIVMDEVGRLERDALMFQRAIGLCLDGGKPVLGVLRKRGTSWADWIRERPDVRLLEVTDQTRDAVPGEAAALLRPYIAPARETPWAYRTDVRYQIEPRAMARFAQPPAEYPRSYAGVWVTDARGRLLLIRRHPHARFAPGLFDMPGGWADEGETPAEAAARELFEETGIRVRPESLTPLANAPIYRIQADLPLTALRLQPDEAVAARWESPDAVRALMEGGEAVARPLPEV